VTAVDGCSVRMVDREKVALVREVMPSGHDVTEATDVFAPLGDPNRLLLDAALTHAHNATALHPEQHDVSILAGADV